jgi:TolA-binding protein
MAKKTKSKNASNILVRKLKAKDNKMLDELQKITGYKSNARNVMLASHECLRQRGQILQLNKKINDLNATINKMSHDHVERLEKTVQEFNAYKEQVKQFTQISLQRVCSDLSHTMNELKYLTVRAKKFVTIQL